MNRSFRPRRVRDRLAHFDLKLLKTILQLGQQLREQIGCYGGDHAEPEAAFHGEPTAPGECLDLAGAFGTVFIDPAAVTCATVAFPQVAQGSFATNLTGTIRAGEFDVNLTIMIVAFNMGNVSAVVGSAAAFDPPVDDMITQVTLVTDRIGQAQAAE